MMARKKGCPNCGERRFSRVPSARIFQFAYDRECDRCGMRYSIPVPRWAPPVCAVLGGVVILGGGVFCYFAITERWPGGALRSLLMIATGVGIAAWAARTWRGEPRQYSGSANQALSLSEPPRLQDQHPQEDSNRSDIPPPVL